MPSAEDGISVNGCGAGEGKEAQPSGGVVLICESAIQPLSNTKQIKALEAHTPLSRHERNNKHYLLTEFLHRLTVLVQYFLIMNTPVQVEAESHARDINAHSPR